MSNFLTVQAQRFRLAGSGITSSATTIVLQSFKTPAGTNIVTADFGAIGYLTLDPGTSKEEVISFTTVTQNADGTATLTGVTRGLGFTTPYTTVSANQLSHAGGSVAVLSNPSAFYNKFPAKANDETITGYWTAPDPLSSQGIVTRDYMISLINGGTVSIDSLKVAGTAGETVAAGNLIYFKTSDAQWWKTDADTAATVEGVLLGLAQGSGTAGNSIAGGVLIRGLDLNQSGLSAGSNYYAGNTAGAISSSAGTTSKIIGVAKSTTSIYFDPVFNSALTASEKAAIAGGSTFGTPSGTNKFITQDYNASATGLPVVRVYLTASSPATWTKPAGLKYVVVEVQAGGGAGGIGGGNANDRGSGGGAGGYSKKTIAVATLGATETVTIGAAAGNSSFGAHATTTGGSAGVNATSGIILGGAGGAGASGDINVTGNYGWNAVTYDAAVFTSGRGAESKFGQGGREVTSNSAGNAAVGYGSGGGGGWGSAGNPVAAGAGAPGIVIVTEYYS